MVLRGDNQKVFMVLESHYPTQGGGGAEGQLRTLCRYLSGKGVPVEVIVPMRQDGPTVEHDEVDGIPVWRVPFPHVKKLAGFVLLARTALGLFRRRREYRVIHAHIAHNMAAVSCVMGRLLGKTVVVKITGSRELAGGVLDPGARGPGIVIKRMAFRQASYFQATSRQIHDRLVEAGFPPERVRIIPNAVDTDRFANIERPMAEPGVLTGVYIGRLEPAKGVDNLVEAWIEAFDRDAPVEALMVGHGAQREQLEKRIEQAGREHQLRLLGPHPDVGRFLAAADFALLPSRYEGLSNALLEAMAASLPVLGTRVSGTEDFLGDGQCGWLVEPDDIGQLAAGLRKVAATRRETLQQMGEAARQRVVARARIDSVAIQLAGLYEIDSERFRSVRHGQYT